MITATTTINSVNYKFTLLLRFKTIAFIVGLLFHQSVTIEPDFAFPLQNVTALEGQNVEFTCVINNLGGYREVFLEVVKPPDNINEIISGTITVGEGGSATLVCPGFSNSNIIWSRVDEHDIIVRNGSMSIIKSKSYKGEILWLPIVLRSEMGDYFCAASNDIPPGIGKRIKLQVHFHPLIRIPNQLVSAPIGSDVKLVCNVEAFPKAINYWKHENGEMIISDDRYNMTKYDTSIYSVQMVLQIVNLQNADFGEYKCVSKNIIGEDELGIVLQGDGVYLSIFNENYEDNTPLNNVRETNSNAKSKLGLTN